MKKMLAFLLALSILIGNTGSALAVEAPALASLSGNTIITGEKELLSTVSENDIGEDDAKKTEKETETASEETIEDSAAVDGEESVTEAGSSEESDEEETVEEDSDAEEAATEESNEEEATEESSTEEETTEESSTEEETTEESSTEEETAQESHEEETTEESSAEEETTSETDMSEESVSDNELSGEENGSMEGSVSDGDIGSVSDGDMATVSDNNILLEAEETVLSTVILERTGESENEIIGEFVTLQEAFNEIERLADASQEYRILLKQDDTNLVKEAVANYSFPSRASSVFIVSEDSTSKRILQYKNDLTVKCNLGFENIMLEPAGTAGKLLLGNYQVSFYNTAFAEGKNITVTGGGIGKGSQLFLAGNGEESVLAAVTNVDTLWLMGTHLTITGNTSLGTLGMRGDAENILESFTGLGSISVKDIQSAGGRRITTVPRLAGRDGKITQLVSNLSISGQVTLLDDSGKLHIVLAEKTEQGIVSFTAEDERVSEELLKKSGIILAKAANVNTDCVLWDGSGENGSIYKKSGNLLYKAVKPQVELQYSISVTKEDGTSSETVLTTICETFADAVAEINNLRTKREYTIVFLPCILGEITPTVLTMPNKNYISKLTLKGEGREVYYQKNITFTSDVVMDNLKMVQAAAYKDKSGNAVWLPTEQVNNYPAPVTINTGGFHLSFAQGTDASVSFNTPVLFNGGGKGTLTLGKNVYMEAWGNKEEAVPESWGAEKSYIQGKITNFAKVNIEQSVNLAGWPSWDSKKKQPVYNTSELNVADLYISNTGLLQVGHENYTDKGTVKNLTLSGGELIVTGNGSFGTVNMAGENPALRVWGTAFSITGTLANTAGKALLEAGLNAKQESALNITGSVVLENDKKPITVKVRIPEADTLKLGESTITVTEKGQQKEKTISTLLLKAKNAEASAFLADVSCVGNLGCYDKNNDTEGYILKQTGEAIHVFYGANIGTAVYEGEELEGYYVTVTDAVNAINSKKNMGAEYTIELLQDQGTEAPIKLTTPKYGEKVTFITDPSAPKKLCYGQDITLASDTVFQDVILVPAVSKGVPKGILTQGFDLTLLNIETEEGSLGKIDGRKTAVITIQSDDGRACSITGAVTNAAELYLDNVTAKIKGSIIVNKISLQQAVLDAENSIAVTDITNKGSQSNQIIYGRNSSNRQPYLNVKGTISNENPGNKLILSLDTSKNNMGSVPVKELKISGSKVTLSNDAKVALIEKAAMNDIVFQIGGTDVSGRCVWADKAIFILQESYAQEAGSVVVTAGDSQWMRCLDITRASSYIDLLNKRDSSYTIQLTGNIRDTHATDNTAVSKLVLPKKDKAGSIIIDGTAEGTYDLTFTGDVVTNGAVAIRNVNLVNAKDFSISNVKNSDQKTPQNAAGEAQLILENVTTETPKAVPSQIQENVEETTGKIKNITGVKNATKVFLKGQNIQFSGGITNVAELTVETTIVTKAKSEVGTLRLSDHGAWDALGITAIGQVEVLANGTESYVGTYHSLNNKGLSTGLPQLTITGQVDGNLPVKLFDVKTGQEIGNDLDESGRKELYNNAKLIVAKTASAEHFVAYPYGEWQNGSFVPASEEIKSYKDKSSYVSNGDISAMEVLLTETDTGTETYVRTYGEAVQIINNIGNKNRVYQITFRNTERKAEGGEGQEGNKGIIKTAIDKNGNAVHGSLALPAANKAAGLIIEGNGLVVEYTGTMAPKCNLTWKNVVLSEGTIKTVAGEKQFVPANQITLNVGNVKVTIGENVTTQNAEQESAWIQEVTFYKLSGQEAYNLIFKSISGSKGTLVLEGRHHLYAKGDIQVQNLVTTKDAVAAGGGKISLGDITFCTDSSQLRVKGQKAITLNQIQVEEGVTQESIVIDTYYTKKAWKQAVSQLSITGEAAQEVSLSINPYVYDAKNALEPYSLMSDVQIGELLITAEQKPASWQKLLQAPKMKVVPTGTSSGTISIGEYNSYYPIKYEGGIYLSKEPSSIEVAGTTAEGKNLYTGQFLSWEQAVKEIDRLNHPEWSYVITVTDDLGTGTVLSSLPMPSKAENLLITSVDGEKGIFTTSDKIAIKCDTTIEDIAITAVKKTKQGYESKNFTLDTGKFNLTLKQLPENYTYIIEKDEKTVFQPKENPIFQQQIQLSGAAQGSIIVIPNETGTMDTPVTLLSKISAAGTVRLEPMGTQATYYKIDKGISGVGSLILQPAVDVSCGNSAVSVKNLAMGESMASYTNTEGEKVYPYNSSRSYLEAKNITVSSVLTMASSTLKAGTDTTGDGRIELNQVVLEDGHNHLEGKQDKKGNSLIKINGEATPKGENINPSWSAATIALCVHNSRESYAQLTEGTILLTGKKAASSLFRPYHEQTDSQNSEDIYGAYNAGNYVKYGKLQEASEGLHTSVTEVRLWIGMDELTEETRNNHTYMEFMVFEEAVSAINNMSLYKLDENGKNTKVFREYTIEVLKAVEIGNVKGDGKYSTLTLPSKASQVTIAGNENEIRFSGNLALRCNTALKDIILLPLKQVKGKAEPASVNLAISNYTLFWKQTECGYWTEEDTGVTFTTGLANVTGSPKSGKLVLGQNSMLEAKNITGLKAVEFTGDGNSILMDENGEVLYGILTANGNLSAGEIRYERYGAGKILVEKNLTVNSIYTDKEAENGLYIVEGTQAKINGKYLGEDKCNLFIITDRSLHSGTKLLTGNYLNPNNWNLQIILDREEIQKKNIYLYKKGLYLGSSV